MRIITREELKHRTTAELEALYAWACDEVRRTSRMSGEYLQLMVMLENIRIEQLSRRFAPPPPRGP